MLSALASPTPQHVAAATAPPRAAFQSPCFSPAALAAMLALFDEALPPPGASDAEANWEPWTAAWIAVTDVVEALPTTADALMVKAKAIASIWGDEEPTGSTENRLIVQIVRALAAGTIPASREGLN